MKGFYAVDGVQEGVRTLEESLEGLGLLSSVVKGMAVLDLGCAEGLISQFCLERGAFSVLGYDKQKAHIDKARTWAKERFDVPDTIARTDDWVKGLEFRLADFNDVRTLPHPETGRWQVVLALSVIHKLRMDKRLPFLVRVCGLTGNWLFIRSPAERLELTVEKQPGKKVSGSLRLVETIEANGFRCVEQVIKAETPWVGVFRRV